MERDVNDDTCGKDDLRLTEDELGDLIDEVGPNAHGHIKEGFEEVVIELDDGTEIELSGYGGGSVSLAVQQPGLNGNSCVNCEEGKHERELQKIRGGSDDRAVYICRECKEDNPALDQLLS